MDPKKTQTKTEPYPAQIQPGIVQSSDLPNQTGNPELFRVKIANFWDLFPSELVIQQKTVSIIRKELLASYVETIPVKDISQVVFSVAGSYASLTIAGKNPISKLKITHLSPKDAKKAKEIIEKLMAT